MVGTSKQLNAGLPAEALAKAGVMTGRNVVGSFGKSPFHKMTEFYRSVAQHVGIRCGAARIIGHHAVDHLFFVLVGKTYFAKGYAKRGGDAHGVEPVLTP